MKSLSEISHALNESLSKDAQAKQYAGQLTDSFVSGIGGIIDPDEDEKLWNMTIDAAVAEILKLKR